MITVCAHCGEARTILFLRKDRWLCTKCRMEGVAPPNLPRQVKEAHSGRDLSE